VEAVLSHRSPPVPKPHRRSGQIAVDSSLALFNKPGATLLLAWISR
jgi:hypothetical protein